MRRTPELNLVVKAKSLDDYLLVRQAFENLKLDNDIYVSFPEEGFGLNLASSSQEQTLPDDRAKTFTVKFEFPLNLAEYLRGALSQIGRSALKAHFFLQSGSGEPLDVHSQRYDGWLRKIIADTCDDFTLRSSPKTSRAEDVQYAWESADIQKALGVLVAALLAGAILFIVAAGSISLGLARGWAILLIIALIGTPISLLWGLRRK